MRSRIFVAPLLLSLSAFGCDDGQGGDDEAADEVGTTDDDAGTDDAGTDDTDTDGDTTGGPIDTDKDGLSDEEEAMLGTDPTKKDTDGDNYWDPWELIEGTDPLDVASRIYTGYWPYNPDKATTPQGAWATASKNVGEQFPAAEFLDQHGDMVNVYDFARFNSNATMEDAYFIFDLSAQWCGPCHNVASWISGTDDANTSWIQTLYPTVRDKVHGLRIWWLTFVVENSAGGAPTAGDAVTWFNTHQDNYIPIMADVEQKMWPNFGSDAYPHFFLLDPDLRIEYFPGPGDSNDSNPYPAVGLVDTLL